MITSFYDHLKEAMSSIVVTRGSREPMSLEEGIEVAVQMVTDPETAPPEELGDLEALQGVAKFPVRVKCATLAWHALADGIKQREAGGVTRHEE